MLEIHPSHSGFPFSFFQIEQANILNRKSMEAMLTKKEIAVFSHLSSPYTVQQFLDRLDYSKETHYRCPRSVLRDRMAHCYDGAIFAAAALRMIGYPPLIVEILPNERDDDHILAIFKRNNHWGAVAKSNFVGLRYREPVYRTVRELMMSYFESYYNVARERTMLGYTAALNLNQFDVKNWLTCDSAMDAIGNALDRIHRYSILTPAMKRELTHVDKRFAIAGLLGAKRAGLFKL